MRLLRGKAMIVLATMSKHTSTKEAMVKGWPGAR
jgi:hypothetical protein